jgi:hypothetical protein
MRSWTLGLALALGMAGCKDEATAVRTTCETRTEWQHEVARKCTNCLAKSSTPKCNASCTDKEYSGTCAAEEDAVRKEPSCEGVDRCLHECKADDCGCEERCYEGKPRCKELAGARDACTTNVCDAYCR